MCFCYISINDSANKNKTVSIIVNCICIYTVSQKNDTDVAGYIFNAHQPILVVFGRDVGEKVCYWMVICYPTSPN